MTYNKIHKQHKVRGQYTFKSTNDCTSPKLSQTASVKAIKFLPEINTVFYTFLNKRVSISVSIYGLTHRLFIPLYPIYIVFLPSILLCAVEKVWCSKGKSTRGIIAAFERHSVRLKTWDLFTLSQKIELICSCGRSLTGTWWVLWLLLTCECNFKIKCSSWTQADGKQILFWKMCHCSVACWIRWLYEKYSTCGIKCWWKITEGKGRHFQFIVITMKVSGFQCL